MIHTNYWHAKNLGFKKIMVDHEKLDELLETLPKYQITELSKTFNQLEGPDMQNAAADLFFATGENIVVGTTKCLDGDKITLSLKKDFDGKADETTFVPINSLRLGSKLLAAALGLAVDAMKDHEKGLKEQVKEKVQDLVQQVEKI